MYSIFLTNFGYSLESTFDDLQAAIAHGKSKGFDFIVQDKLKNLLASWSYFGGTKLWI